MADFLLESETSNLFLGFLGCGLLKDGERAGDSDQTADDIQIFHLSLFLSCEMLDPVRRVKAAGLYHALHNKHSQYFTCTVLANTN